MSERPEKPTQEEVEGAMQMLAPVELDPAREVSVFRATDPAGVLARASEVAKLLVPIIVDQKLFRVIGTKKFVFCEGWTSMGAMLGVFPYVEWSRRMPHETLCLYEARVVLRTMSGTVVGAGESMCSSAEQMNGKDRWQDEYAIRSMAETRATAKAFRLCFSWVMVMAGYAPTPAEEMEGVQEAQKGPSEPLAPPTPTQDTPKAATAPLKGSPAIVPLKSKEGSASGGTSEPPKRGWIPPFEWLEHLDDLMGRLKPEERQKASDWLYDPSHRNPPDWFRMTAKLRKKLAHETLPPLPECVASGGIEALNDDEVKP